MEDFLNRIPHEVTILIIALATLLWFYLVFRMSSRSRKMKNYRSVCIGQTKEEVIKLNYSGDRTVNGSSTTKK